MEEPSGAERCISLWEEYWEIGDDGSTGPNIDIYVEFHVIQAFGLAEQSS